MGILGRKVFREVAAGALLGSVLFTFVLFLQRLGKLFEQLVTSTATPELIGTLFALILPQVLTFTIPVGVLVGVLVAMGRMSADAEIIAMRACGSPSRRLLIPVGLFALIGAGLTAYTTCILNPWATRETFVILNRMVAAQVTAEIQPRIFEEQFPNRILYVREVGPPGPTVRWSQVFMADLSPPAERKGAGERGDAPRITISSETLASPDAANNRIQLAMRNGSSFEVGKDIAEYFSTSFPKGEQALDAPKRNELKPSGFSQLDMEPLRKQMEGNIEAAIDFHRRLALPVACLVLAMLAVPLGVSSRKGGKSSAFVLTVALGFFYFMGLIGMIGLARQKTLPPGMAVWMPNMVFAALSLVLIVRLEKPDDVDWSQWTKDLFQRLWKRLRGSAPFRNGEEGVRRLPLLPQIIDTYVLSSFLYYWIVLTLAFVGMTHVFTFFELLGDIVKNKIPMARVAAYHLFLTPRLLYDAAPLSVLVAVLVTFGLLARSNEITAMKACGISVYRLTVPVLLASLVISGLLFAFDYSIVPEANLVQDAIRNEIKGRPVQTYYRPDRKWILGQGPWIYYYKHMDPAENVMIGVSVYELDARSFRMKRHIAAERARWEPTLQRWVFQNGWMRDFNGISVTQFQNFEGKTATFEELTEPPSWFLKEVKQYTQMNFHQLRDYIRELRQSGFDTVRFEVQYHKKFAVPLFAAIMAIISLPFAFFSGNRGATAPVGISLAIAICYWALGQLFEQMGNVGQLPAEMAAWSPDVVFSLAGIYFMMRVRT
ncbi:MAG: LptF/LptG family permease [Candidatus Solibacter usitatus]|nr:LptF/LptG family permease [Candidatus Solibacter usitatus]